MLARGGVLELMCSIMTVIEMGFEELVRLRRWSGLNSIV